ncbi:MAG: hypothetical protein U0996_12225 [Planctomycetaceae bacterium]
MPKHSSFVDLPCTLESLRVYLGTPANLPTISNPDMELEILNAPAAVTRGEKIEFRISALGFKQRATHEYLVCEFDEIVESMTDGVLKRWVHRQKLEQLESGLCRLTDEIEFEPPGGMLGFVLTEDRIRENIADGMEHRYSTLRELIEEGVIQ